MENLKETEEKKEVVQPVINIDEAAEEFKVQGNQEFKDQNY
jgi:hypothetical protein